MSSKVKKGSVSSPAPEVTPKKTKKASVSADDDQTDSPKKRRKLSTGSTQSCHQCRQSILSNKGISELKAGKARRQCDTCTTYWCENCLENRYGLSFVEISGAKWSCPKCTKTCNCSICRKRAGMLATGILTPLAKEAGFGSVNEFLVKGTGAIAECLQWTEKENAEQESPKSEKKKTTKRKRAASEGSALAEAEPSPPKAKRAKKSDGKAAVTGRSRLKSDFEVDLRPPKVVHRRTSLAEKRVSAEEYRLRVKEREEEIARQKEEEKQRKKTAKIEDAAKAKELKKQALEEIRAQKAEEKEKEKEEKAKERRRSQELKQEELEEARRRKADEIEQQKEAKRQDMERLREERKQEKSQKEEEHKQQLEEMRKKKAEEREKEKEEKKKELFALREEKARAKDEEREAKKQQLESIRALVSQQKQAVKDLLSVTVSHGRSSSSSSSSGSKPNFSRTPSNTSSASASASDSESGIDCDFILPPIVPVEVTPDICISIDLPALPAWDVPVPVSQCNNLLLVAEFLASFSSLLGLSQKYTAGKLASSLLTRTTVPSIQYALMKVLLKAEQQEQDGDEEDDGFDEDEECGEGRIFLDQLPKLTMTSCQKVVDLYLAMAGYEPESTIKGAGRRKMNADERAAAEKLSVLAFLCERLIGMRYIADVVNETSDDLAELQRKHRVAEREVCKKINEELKVWTAEQLMARKDFRSGGEVNVMPSASEKFSKQIADVRSKQQCEHDACSAAVRGQLLGRDRNGRAYWHLQCISGMLVEEDSTSAAATSESTASGSKRSARKDRNPFTVCASVELLDRLLDSLCLEHPAEAALSHQIKLRYNVLCGIESREVTPSPE